MNFVSFSCFLLGHRSREVPTAELTVFILFANTRESLFGLFEGNSFRSDELHPGNSYFFFHSWAYLNRHPNFQNIKAKGSPPFGGEQTSPSEPQLSIPSPLLLKNSTKIPMQKLSSCPGFRKTAQIQAGGGSRAFPIYSAVTARHITLCCPWLTGRAELEGFPRHHCNWEIASRLCGTQAGQEQSENNCTALCRGKEFTSRMEKMGVEVCSKVFYCPGISF